MNWIVSQIGAREHYAVPRAFEQFSHLQLFYTDAWCRWGRGMLSRGPAPMRALAGRWHPDVPARKVISFSARTLWEEARDRRGSTTRDAEAMGTQFVRVGQAFGERVARHLSRQPLDPSADAFFGYNTGCLETLEMLRDRGIPTVVDQIDPARVEEELVHQESLKWPGWQAISGRTPEVYWKRLESEWKLATAVLVNSAWSKAALIRQGVDPNKIIVVPLAHETTVSDEEPKAPRDASKPLAVLWVGSVILRKGIQYLVEAARQLKERNVRFTIAGPIGISDDAVRSAPANIEFLGRITRDRTRSLYRSADVFVLPTISDGFAITQLEAMANGLPVITTPNCGEVVTDGRDGFIVPASDAVALAKAIARLIDDGNLIRNLSAAAFQTAKRFSLQSYANATEAGLKSVIALRDGQRTPAPLPQ